MSSRHVHFNAGESLINTPSPSWSDSSLPSSTGPITPPTRGSELPTAGSYRAQPALSAYNEDSILDYDLSLPPHTVALPLTKAKANMADILTQTAAIPNLPTLEFSHVKLPWTMYIHPDKSTTTDYLLVGEIIKGLYANLRQSVRREEYSKESAERKARIDYAFQQRVNRAGKKGSHEREAELKKGLKRIDFLEGNDIFKGFEQLSSAPGNHWRLVTARRTGA